MMTFGFDDPATHRLFWVNLFLDVSEELDEDVVRMVRLLRPVDELLDALRAEQPEVRDRATQMLWYLWMAAAGDLAYGELLRGIEQIENNRWDEALECFTQLTENFPDFAEAYNKRATVHYHKRDYIASKKDCQTALRLNPDHFGAWHGLGLCFFRLREYEKACVAFRRALRIQPYSDDNVRMLAYCRGQILSKTASARSGCGRPKTDDDHGG